jgi:hypothetical protein
MQKSKFLILISLINLLFSCKKEEEAQPIVKSSEAKLSTFSFKKENNLAILSADVEGCLKQNLITLNIPITDLASPNTVNVIPSFSISIGAKLFIDGQEIVSDKTAFKATSKPTEITIKAENGFEQKYTFEITSRILNIQNFLSICPKDDPAFSQILKDFEIRKNGLKLNSIDFDCNDKQGRAMRLLQALRLYYYVDVYKPKGYLPFTNLRLYDWLKAEVKGFDLKDDFTAAGACCTLDQGRKFMTLGTEKTESAAVIKYNYTEWEFLAGYTSLIAHERRHAEPTNNGYPHTGNCNNILGDDDYNEANLGAYGVAYWLSKAFKTGVLEVGVSCLSKQKQDEINNLIGENRWAATYFCKNAPQISWAAKYAPCACQ